MNLKESIKNILLNNLNNKCAPNEIDNISSQINHKIDSHIRVVDKKGNQIWIDLDDVDLITRNSGDKFAIFSLNGEEYSKIITYQETLELVGDNFEVYDRHNLVNKEKIKKIDSEKYLIYLNEQTENEVKLETSIRFMDSFKRNGFDKQNDFAYIRNQSRKAKGLGRSMLFFLQ